MRSQRRSSASRCQGRAVLGPTGLDGGEVRARGMGAACEDIPAPSAPVHGTSPGEGNAG